MVLSIEPGISVFGFRLGVRLEPFELEDIPNYMTAMVKFHKEATIPLGRATIKRGIKNDKIFIAATKKKLKPIKRKAKATAFTGTSSARFETRREMAKHRREIRQLYATEEQFRG